jgi:branched-chain amino acid transport system ATP-binding protein
MSVTVRAGRPDSPEGTALLRASQAYLASLYSAEHCHYLSIEALCAPHIRFFIAEDESRACGCAALAVMGDYGEVKSMFVDPDARGAGTGAALMARPRICLFDEPSLGLAPKIVASVFETLAQIKAMGMTILLVEQNSMMALNLADRAYLFEAGKIVMEGPAKELKSHPEVMRAYLGH